MSELELIKWTHHNDDPDCQYFLLKADVLPVAAYAYERNGRWLGHLEGYDIFKGDSVFVEMSGATETEVKVALLKAWQAHLAQMYQYITRLLDDAPDDPLLCPFCGAEGNLLEVTDEKVGEMIIHFIYCKACGTDSSAVAVECEAEAV